MRHDNNFAPVLPLACPSVLLQLAHNGDLLALAHVSLDSLRALPPMFDIEKRRLIDPPVAGFDAPVDSKGEF
jgi:hypothetical protein